MADFDTMFQQFMVDIDGDGVPDVPAGDPLAQRKNQMAMSRRAMAGREPTPEQQAIYAAGSNDRTAAAERLGGVAVEATGLPMIGRGVQDVARGIDEGNGWRTAAGVGQAALGALPLAAGARAASPLLNMAFGSAPRAMATTAAASLPLAVADAQDAAALTRRQKRELEMQQRQQQIEDEAAQRRQQMELQAEQQRQQMQIEAEARRTQMSAESERQALEAKRQADAEETRRPWREQNPEWAAALPAAGYALAAGLPFGLKTVSRLGSWLPGSYASRVNKATNLGEQALVASGRKSVENTAKMGIRESELLNLINSQKSEKLKDNLSTAGAALSGGFLSAEGRIFPDQMDRLNPNLTQEQRDQALANMGDLGNLALNVGLGSLLGLSAQKAAGLVPARRANIDGARAVQDNLRRKLKRKEMPSSD